MSNRYFFPDQFKTNFINNLFLFLIAAFKIDMPEKIQFFKFIWKVVDRFYKADVNLVFDQFFNKG